ncbi:MAG: hypothetical protein M1269_12685 [Chloroflexi bacterium]|nr:hypothetical protein [Chloroflexota bacterium]
MSRKSIMFMVVLFMAAFLFSAAWADNDKPKEKGKEKQQVQKSNNDTNAEKDKDKQKNKEEKKIQENPGQVKATEVKVKAPPVKTKTKKVEVWIPPHLSSQERVLWSNGRPPGWQQGNKTGWGGGSLPPGLAKKFYQPQYRPMRWDFWTVQQRENWRRDFENTKLEIWERARILQIVDPNIYVTSVYYATDQGVPIYWTRRVVDIGMDRGLSAYEIEQLTRAMAYGAANNVAFIPLGNFIILSIENGVRGDALSLGVYKEIVKLNM